MRAKGPRFRYLLPVLIFKHDGCPWSLLCGGVLVKFKNFKTRRTPLPVATSHVGSARSVQGFKKAQKKKTKVDAAPGLPGRSPIPVLFRPKGA